MMVKLILLLVVTSMMLLVGGVEVFGAEEISNPYQLIGTGTSQDFEMDLTSYLFERIEGVDSKVVKNWPGQYYIFFGKIVSGNLQFGAYVSTDNSYSNPGGFPGYEAWCKGSANRDRFLENESPDYVLVIYDDDGERFALRYPGGALVFDDNIIAWESGLRFLPSNDIEYDGAVDGLLSFDFGAISIDTILIESIVLVPYSGPVLREGPYDMNDLADFVDYWLSECDGTNDYCEGLDFDNSGTLNFVDFAYIADDWAPALREGPYDMNDLADFVSYWLSDCGWSNGYCVGLDFDGSGTLNFVDFSYIANDWMP